MEGRQRVHQGIGSRELTVPVGAEDQYPAPDEVAQLEQALIDAGKTFEFHTYDGAGHAFFCVDRPAYRPEAANDGWQKIWDFYGRNLAG